MAFWRNRDHERFIGSYDPEHEMPNPDRQRMGRYESDAYRQNAEDSRYGYRWNADQFESRFQGRHRDDVPFDRDWNRDARDRFYEDRYAQTRMGRNEQSSGYGGRGEPDRGWDYGRDRGGRDMGGLGYGERGFSMPRDYGRSDRGYGVNYGSDRDRMNYGPDRDRMSYGSDRDRYGYDRDRHYGHYDARDRGGYRNGPGRDQGDRGRTMPDWDREARAARDRDYGWEDVDDISFDRNRGRRY